ncbi:MAG: diacylglycerol kinase family protein [Gemmatimonadota bacterium]
MATAKSIDVILNPAAGGGAGRKHRSEIERELAARDVACRVHESTGPGDAVNQARSLVQQGARVIVAAGGDGTMHEVANGILEADSPGECALGLIPLGTGNDFVKVVPGTRARMDAYQTLAHGVSERFDVGQASWDGRKEFFLNGMGTGVDVEVVRQLQSLPPLPGALKYLLALLRALIGYSPVELTVNVDGVGLRERVMIVAVGNGVCQGGGFYLAPDATPKDGLLDLCLVKRLSALGMARVLPRILRGTQRGDPAVFMRTGREFRFEADRAPSLFFHLDGELREARTSGSVQVRVLPARLPVLTRSTPVGR